MRFRLGIQNSEERYNSITDKELFALMRNDDQRAFTALYNRHAQHLYSVLMRYLKSEELVENALQDVFLKFWDERKYILTPSNIKGYLYISMRNSALNVVKRHQNGLKKAYEVAQSLPKGYEMVDVERAQMRKELQKRINELPETMRNIVVQKQEGFTNEEISKKLKIPINTVAVYYSRAIKILREKSKGLYTILLLLIVYIIE